jgi:hypothetical protein
MSISYQPRQAQVQDVQLKVQQLVLKTADTDVLSGSGTTSVVVAFGQAVGEVRACLHLDDSAGSLIVRNQAAISFNAARTIATITLSIAFEDNKDSLIIDFVASKA